MLPHFQDTAILASLLGTANPARFAINNVGNGFLKRFKLIFDSAYDVLYLQPNQQWRPSF